MNRRKFLRNSGAALSGTALYMTGRNVNPVSGKQLTPDAIPNDFAFAPDMRRLNDETTGFATSEWGSDVIAYARTPKIEESSRKYQPHGLVFQCTFMVANVMDSEGTKYNLLRSFDASSSIITHATRSIPDGVTLAQPIFKPGEMYMSRCENEQIESKAIQVKPYLANPGLMNILLEPQKAQWQDVSGRVNFEYKALGPALEFYCPGLLEDNMYRSEPQWVKGTIDGIEVQGFGVIDSAWGPAGTDWSQSKIFRYLEEYWVVWCNVYEDDSKECGVYMSGVDNFGCGYYNPDGQALVRGRSDTQILWTPDGFIQGANFSVGDTAFEFTMNARVVKAPGYLSWASGAVRRVDEKRTPKMSFAWFEFLPKR